jgi:hypothetical protein
VERKDEHGHTRHQKQAADKLHEALGDELVEFIGVVVDTRNQVASLVFCEEGKGQVLQGCAT